MPAPDLTHRRGCTEVVRRAVEISEPDRCSAATWSASCFQFEDRNEQNGGDEGLQGQMSGTMNHGTKGDVDPRTCRWRRPVASPLHSAPTSNFRRSRAVAAPAGAQRVARFTFRTTSPPWLIRTRITPSGPRVAPIAHGSRRQHERRGRADYAPEGAERRAPASSRRSSARSTEFSEDNLTDWAAALTYYGLLALFPALIALLSILGLFGDPATTTQTLTDIVTSIVPQLGRHTFSGPIKSITVEPRAPPASALSSASSPRSGRPRATSAPSSAPPTSSTRRRKAARSGSSPAAAAGHARMVILLAVVIARDAGADRPGRRRRRRPDRDRRHRADRLEHRQVAGAARRPGR